MLVSLAFIFGVYAGDLQASPEKTVQYDEARLKSADAAIQQEKNNQNSIDEEWYHALEDTRQQLRKTKNEYDNYYFYSNGCLAVVLIIILVKIARKKFGVAPSDGMDYQPLLGSFLHLTDAQNHPVQRGLAENNKEKVYDEIQKRWDEKVGAQDNINIKTKKYDEIQKMWDEQVLGA
jgi:hypothetical protein